MRRLFPFLLLFGLLTAPFAGCDSADSERGTVTLTGEVFDADRNQPIEGAFVTIKASDNPDIRAREDIILETDANGQFSTSFEISEPTDVSIEARRDGYTTDSQTIFAVADRTIQVPRFRLSRTRTQDPISGTPSNILLLGQSSETIGVVESGSAEVTVLTFQVADSAGNPVTLENEALVRFRLGQQPGGDAFIAPEQAGTDDNGQVEVNLSSGTRAGVVQIVAETDVDGRTIRSKPVSVTIHGGLPDQNHFTLGPEQFNFAGLNVFGVRNGIGVLVGDKFSNPARPGTAVYFSTSHGVIQGSTLTSADGQGGVDLISGNPLPFPNANPTPLSPGVTIVRAETAGTSQNLNNTDAPGYGEELVFDEIAVVISGSTTLSTNISGPPILGQTYSFTVADQLGNPLAPGTSISVSAEGTNVKAVGDVAVTLGDTFIAISCVSNQGCERTPRDIISAIPDPDRRNRDFRFTPVSDQELDEETDPELHSVTIAVDGPNGRLQVTFGSNGTVQASEDTELERLSDGTIRVRALE